VISGTKNNQRGSEQKMSRARRMTVGVAVAAFVAAGAGVATVAATAAPQAPLTPNADQQQASDQDQDGVPEQIRVPNGYRRIAVMPSRGVQTYQCTNGAWTFLQPDAILQFNGSAEVLHTRGPVWTSVIDGSSVTAAVVASAPRPDAIPELLLSSTANRGPGLLADVRFVQRLDTTGGLSPTGACTGGATASVPYTADYAFWTRG
jgi:hypothetical protein